MPLTACKKSVGRVERKMEERKREGKGMGTLENLRCPEASILGMRLWKHLLIHSANLHAAPALCQALG